MKLDDHALKQLFTEARTFNTWQAKPVSDALLHELVDLTKMGPTSANCLPMRLIFLRTPEGKAKLKPLLAPGNVDKTMSAPVTAIIGHDLAFYEHLPKMFPHADARSWFIGPEKKAHADATAFRNASLQGGYLIMAARALGLDVGAMSGFNAAGVDEAFFAGTEIKSNFLLNIGYGERKDLFPRSPRFSFDEMATLA